MAQNQFSDKDNELLKNLVTKYKAYSKPTDTQKLLVSLYELQNKNDDDFKKLQALLKVEKKAIAHFNEQKKLKDMLKSEKDKERKALEHNKFCWAVGCGRNWWKKIRKLCNWLCKLFKMVRLRLMTKMVNFYLVRCFHQFK